LRAQFAVSRNREVIRTTAQGPEAACSEQSSTPVRIAGPMDLAMMTSIVHIAPFDLPGKLPLRCDAIGFAGLVAICSLFHA
jgi:hypothetical protein